MKKIIVWLLVLTLTAAVSIGATLAYLTDTDEDVNVMTLGKVKIDQLEYERVDDETADDDAAVQGFHDNKPLYPAITEKDFDYTPGDTYVDWEQIGKDGYTSDIWDPTKINNEIDKMVFVKNKGDYDAYVRSVFAFEANGYTFEEFQELFHLNLNDTDWTWEWAQEPVEISDKEGTTTTNYFIATATYNKVLKPGELTEISLSQIALDSKADNEDIAGFGDTYQVLVKSQGIQADGFDGPDAALNEGFGLLIENTGTAEAPRFTVARRNLPFANDSAIKGIDLRTALHNLNGNTAKPITANVTNVIYALNEEYPEIVDGYDGTLVDVEQDVPVYAYYVPNGSHYDVYFLADGTIYSPKDSSALYRKMSSLVTVDTHNYDVSRVENMYTMFHNCQKLTTLDTSHWDTSKVTSLSGAFANCYALEHLDTSGWDLSNNETMYYTFQKCYALDELDGSNWGLENVTTMEGAFAYCGAETINGNGWDLSNCTNTMDTFKFCENLKTVDATGWDTDLVTTTKRMFFHCYALENVVGITDWDLSANTDMYYMFEECDALTGLDLSGWKLGSAVDMKGVFFNCDKLESVNVTGWDTSKADNMYAMFHGCVSLKEIIGTGGWNVSNVTDMSQMFRGCAQLTALDVADWRPGKVVTFSSTFSGFANNAGEMQLKDIDVSQWDMSGAKNLNWMFYGCGQLTDLDLSAWDVSNVEQMHHTFADCFKMENYNFSGWDTSKVITMDGIFNSNLALKTIDVSDFDTGSVEDFDQFFDGCTSLENIIGLDKFDTSSGKYFQEFLLNTKVKVLDLSSFNMSSATHTTTMIYINSELTTIYAGDNWNLNIDQLVAHGSMFAGCGKLVGGSGTTTAGNPVDATYARIDIPAEVDAEGNVITEAIPGYLTHISAKP